MRSVRLAGSPGSCRGLAADPGVLTPRLARSIAERGMTGIKTKIKVAGCGRVCHGHT